MAPTMDFAFLLKKVLTVLVTPVGMVLALLILGLSRDPDSQGAAASSPTEKRQGGGGEFGRRPGKR
jgi:hypothetical protein